MTSIEVLHHHVCVALGLKPDSLQNQCDATGNVPYSPELTYIIKRCWEAHQISLRLGKGLSLSHLALLIPIYRELYRVHETIDFERNRS